MVNSISPAGQLRTSYDTPREGANGAAHSLFSSFDCSRATSTPAVAVVSPPREELDEFCGYLQRYGFKVLRSREIFEFQSNDLDRKPDIVLLDYGLATAEATSLFQRLVDTGVPTFLVFDDRYSEVDWIVALERGATQCVRLGDDWRRIVAQIRSVLRMCASLQPLRSEGGGRDSTREVWTLARRGRLLIAPDGRRVHLTGGQVKLLSLLCENGGAVVPRDTLFRACGAAGSERGRAVDSAIRRLRQVLSGAFPDAEVVKTAYGGGYLFTQPCQVTP